ncbi:putative membrane protein [Keratinibaculum paraultunense]|uniref:Putative membrane protein n=1 Tax=Keratinibaculum paraultunense TaxID=1278232 RepID=A0A4R3KX29_9FIRM|nr:DUF979 domain-containing protein [Keratinibaculum paraultunense]QQY79250.1 DUF979 domain-containing protein [Keratinibaculum paraultunense]TCS89380.1 putative membrane protein [Keratinibaculum paraultunense]
MSFFTDPEVLLGTKLLEIVYILIGLVSFNTGIKNALDEKNPSRLGTAIFWCSLGIVLAFGRWIPPIINGILIIVMTIPAILNKVKSGEQDEPTEKEMAQAYNEIGMKIFIPALAMGVSAIIFAIFTDLGALVGVSFGVLIAMVILRIYSERNSLKVFLDDSERFLSLVGPLSMLPMLLASLGAIFTEAGVGEVIAQIVGNIIPEGNVNIGIVVYALGMMLFTMIMGNAFAAITVMTVGIGGPFVLKYGANPALVGMLALTCGYCGTLLTPMAANFNIVPVAILDMEDEMGVIKNQVIPSLFLIVFQIAYMIMFK